MSFFLPFPNPEPRFFMTSLEPFLITPRQRLVKGGPLATYEWSYTELYCNPYKYPHKWVSLRVILPWNQWRYVHPDFGSPPLWYVWKIAPSSRLKGSQEDDIAKYIETSWLIFHGRLLVERCLKIMDTIIPKILVRSRNFESSGPCISIPHIKGMV